MAAFSLIAILVIGCTHAPQFLFDANGNIVPVYQENELSPLDVQADRANTITKGSGRIPGP